MCLITLRILYLLPISCLCETLMLDNNASHSKYPYHATEPPTTLVGATNKDHSDPDDYAMNTESSTARLEETTKMNLDDFEDEENILDTGNRIINADSDENGPVISMEANIESNTNSGHTSHNKSQCLQATNSKIHEDILNPINQTATGNHKNGKTGNTCKNSSKTISKTGESDYRNLLLGISVENCAYYTCDSHEPLCKCDPLCVLYGDCCYDFLEKLLLDPLFEQSNLTDKLRNRTAFFQMLVSEDSFSSEMFARYHSECVRSQDKMPAIWMVSKCPLGYSDYRIMQKCESGDYYGLDSLPVDWHNPRGRVWTFRNIYCALCHGFHLKDLTHWEVYVQCDRSDEGFIIPAGLVNLMELDPSCSLWFRSSPESARSQRNCEVNQNLTQSCQNIKNSQSNLALCKSYLYPVRNNGSVYRNPHCAVCSTGLSNYSVICQNSLIHEMLKPKVDLRVLFDFNIDKGLSIQASCIPHIQCLYFEVYDCISKHCRRLYCSGDQVPSFGNCIISNFSTHTDFWYEESSPRDLKCRGKDILYIEVEFTTPVLIPLNSKDAIRALIEKFGSIQNESIERSFDQDTRSSSSDNDDTASDEPKHLMLHWNRETSPDGTKIPKEQSKLSEPLICEFNSSLNVSKPKTCKEVFNSSLHCDGETAVLNASESVTNEYIDEHPIIADEVNELNHDAEISFVSNNEQMINISKYVTKFPEIPVESVSTDNINNVKNEEAGRNVSTTLFHYMYSLTLLMKDSSNLSAVAVTLVKTIKQLLFNPDLFDLNDSGAHITVRTYSDLKYLHCDSGNLTVEFNQPYFKDVKEVGLAATGLNKVSANDVFITVSDSSVDREMFDVVAVCLSRFSFPDLKCNMIVYDTAEVDFLNERMLVKNTSLSYESHEFKVIGQKIFTCVDKIFAKPIVRFFQYSKSQRVLSVVTSSISIVCLVIICFSHMVLSRLRNNHGLNLFALSATMLVVQAMILFEPPAGNKACVIFAAVLHFLVLKMFVWMNIIGFDMTITFRANTLTHRKVNIHRFVKYCAFAFTLPLILVSICISLEYSGADVRPGYGIEDVCWLTNSAALIIFFIAPVFISIVSNLVVFSLTLYSIQHAKVNSSVRTNTSRRSYCFVYIKMSLILGFTWSVGIVSAFASFEWLWYVHITLNGLQGLSLFVCSMVNARTISAFRKVLEPSRTITLSLSKLGEETKNTF